MINYEKRTDFAGTFYVDHEILSAVAGGASP
jgi:hypothetical protein